VAKRKQPIREREFGDIGKECQRYFADLRPGDVRAAKHLAIELCRVHRAAISWQDIVRATLAFVAEHGRLPSEVLIEGKPYKEDS
jgi:hypothetical protein